MTEEQRIEQLLQQIADNPKYAGCVFEGPGIYFAIVNGEILTISNDASCSPRGGWFPDIISHPSEEKENFLVQKMNEFGFGEDFFYEAAEEYGPDGVECYFEDEEDEAGLEICQKIAAEIEAGGTPFYSMEDFVKALQQLELDDDLYYEWEGEYIHFYNNICDTGEAPGYFDSIDNAEWIRILENIDNYIVTAD